MYPSETHHAAGRVLAVGYWLSKIELRSQRDTGNAAQFIVSPPFTILPQRLSGPNATVDLSGAAIDRLSNVFIPYYAQNN